VGARVHNIVGAPYNIMNSWWKGLWLIFELGYAQPMLPRCYKVNIILILGWYFRARNPNLHDFYI